MKEKGKQKGKKKEDKKYKKDICPEMNGWFFGNFMSDPSSSDIPVPMRVDVNLESGVIFGHQYIDGCKTLVGMPPGSEGNVLVIGGSCAGKSSGIAMPTLRHCTDAIFAVDPKGELSAKYAEQYQMGIVERPYILFDPMQITGPSYDIFGYLERDEESELIANIRELARNIIPITPNDSEPFWPETEQGVLEAFLLYYYKCGLSFSEAVCKIYASTTSSLCDEIRNSGDLDAAFMLGEVTNMQSHQLACIDRGIRNALSIFVEDPYICHAFRGKREGAKCFSWDDLGKYHIFLCIPANKIDLWGKAINLMLSQLFRYLEKRPEQHSEEGKNTVPILLMLDEFARFGKLEPITSALATLRSKKVNVCLMIQSLAQLDHLYGAEVRRIIVDNCQYVAILRSNDAETQKYLSELIGTTTRKQRSWSEHEDKNSFCTGTTTQYSESIDWVVKPHELSTLRDVILLTPYGYCRVNKIRMEDEDMRRMLFPTQDEIDETRPKISIRKPDDEDKYGVVYTIPAFAADEDDIPETPIVPQWQEDATMISKEQRIANADKRISKRKHQQLVTQRKEKECQKKKTDHRKYIIGELISNYFPEIMNLNDETQGDDEAFRTELEAFLSTVVNDQDLIAQLKEKL